jgi:glycosyltransferase involved in cell wall biosynthesis
LTWHIITGEYPPQAGGVSDYTKLVAEGLAAAGDEVHVWCPSLTNSAITKDETLDPGGVKVHRELGRITPGDLRKAGQLIDQHQAPRRLLVQWVPHAYGYRSMNLPFCLWLWKRARLQNDQVDLMVHEPFLGFGEGSGKQNIAATVHRTMIIALLKAAGRVWVSIPEWEMKLRPFIAGSSKTFAWLPVPSNIPLLDDPAGVATIRARYAMPGELLVGHFGAYDKYLTERMLEALPSLLGAARKPSLLLIGKGSLELREKLTERHSDLAQLVNATGPLSVAELSRHVSACDLMLQPYQDGVSGRRTSVMTALSHGIPVVTTKGKATEQIWSESEAVALADAGDINALVAAAQKLLGDDSERRRLGLSGKELYARAFDLRRTINMLRATTSSPLFALMSAGCE